MTNKDASYETTSVYGFGHPLYYDNVIKTLRGEANLRLTAGKAYGHSRFLSRVICPRVITAA